MASSRMTTASMDIFAWGNAVSDISGPEIKVRFEGLRDYFEQQLVAVTQNLAQSGANIGKKTLEQAETPWGRARMAGDYGGVRFKPYGRSAGRNDTGFMMDSLSAWPGKINKGGRVSVTGYFGWPPEILNSNPYILLQASGFNSKTVFDPQRTAASGIASFKSGSGRYVRGSFPLRDAGPSIRNRAQSAYSAAWNEAKKLWKADGFKGGAPSYVDARGDAGVFVGRMDAFDAQRMGYKIPRERRPSRQSTRGKVTWS
jgi:hypothetical protein